jgi:hypothetical protein
MAKKYLRAAAKALRSVAPGYKTARAYMSGVAALKKKKRKKSKKYTTMRTKAIERSHKDFKKFRD